MILRRITEKEQKKAAKEFAESWKDKGYEKGHSQPFWIQLLRTVYGVEDPEQTIVFEKQVVIDHTSFIDGHIFETKVLIEQKSINKSLDKRIKQSDGTYLTPFEQAKRYSAELPFSKRPRWIITSNFAEFRIYDMENPKGDPEVVLLKDLPKEFYRMQFLVDRQNEHIQKEKEISIQAGEIVGKLYEAFLKEYKDPTDPTTLENLNILCVRLVFLLYAEDAELLGSHLAFHDYLIHHKNNARDALIKLFKILDTKEEDRDPYEEEELLNFPYINGGLFSNENIVIPTINEIILDILLKEASEEFDWSAISPTIFGAVFESTLNPETRRSGGMHYTSVENIHKVIDPLFLDELKDDLNKIKEIPNNKAVQRATKIDNLRNKLREIKILDPACGSGNFLTESYISLRRIENELIREENANTIIKKRVRNKKYGISYTSNMSASSDGVTAPRLDLGGDFSIVQVSIKNFYGIEINDFAVSVTKTALWIAESQMLKETEEILDQFMEFFPLKTQANIVEGNALRIDWNTVVDKSELTYIIGNPPFVGARVMSTSQKAELREIFGSKWKGINFLDYVSGWFKKASDYITETNINGSFVSTNSIVQGELVTLLWRPLFYSGLIINYAYTSFIWDSEANDKAHVHCVIIGFGKNEIKNKYIFSSSNVLKTDNINAYLLPGANVFIESRKKPIDDINPIVFGSMPNDGGFLSDFSTEEKNRIVKKYPKSKSLFHPFVGASEFLHNKERWCLWLKGVSPSLFKDIPPVLDAIRKTKEHRINSSREATKALAEIPYLFGEIRQPDSDYIIIPRHSSQNREYVPIGFENKNVICGDANLLIPDATLYEFGILSSKSHNVWIRTVCGRIKSDYRYSSKIVYNNFPWPEPTEKQKFRIERTAQAILDARNMYPDSSLADLYDDLTMPRELRRAHQANDKAVMDAYGFSIKEITESKCVEELFKLYQQKVEGIKD